MASETSTEAQKCGYEAWIINLFAKFKLISP